MNSTIRFDYQKPINIGSQTAENDELLLKDNFIHTVAANHVGIPRPSIIVGRKGSGKSALRIHFERNHSPKDRAFNIQPSSKDLSAVFSYYNTAEGYEKSVESVMRLWEVTILLNLVKSIFDQDYSLSDNVFLSKISQGLLSDIRSGERYGIGRTLDLFRSSYQTHEQTAELARNIRAFLKDYMINKPHCYFVLIDSIDDVLHSTNYRDRRDDNFFMFFEALITYFRTFINLERNPLASRVFLQIFVPLDIFDRAVGRNFDQVREYRHNVRWDSALLNSFTSSRLIRNLPPYQKNKITQMTNEQARNEAIWDAFFPRYIRVNTYIDNEIIIRDETTRSYLIDFTLKRPRDMQQIIKSINDIVEEEGRRFPDSDMMTRALDRYSSELKMSIEKEYQLVFPELSDILSHLSGNSPSIPTGNMIDLICRVVGNNEQKIQSTMEALYETCVIGAVRGKYSGQAAARFYYDFPDFKAVAKSEQFAIHRALWHAMQIFPHRSGSRF